MSQRMKKRIPDDFMRVLFLKTLHYEASRAGLDPQLVLGLTQVESGFQKICNIQRRRARLHAGDAILA